MQPQKNDTERTIEPETAPEVPSSGQTTVNEPERPTTTDETVKALASSAQDLTDSMLQTKVNLGGKITIAHLDTCATHCFLSEEASAKMRAEGYEAHNSPVRYAVEQGNPLCVTSRVHILPLVMIRNDGTAAQWHYVLFIIANCGADVIIGYPTLRLGGIIDYNPPEQYTQLLRSTYMPPPIFIEEGAMHILHQGRNYTYQAPECAVALATLSVEIHGGTTEPNFTENISNPKLSSKNSENPPPKSERGLPLTLTACRCYATKSRQPIAALTDAEPYGKNPPLPEEVMEALRHLKNLAEGETTTYTASQIEELQCKLQTNKPKWAQGLTLRDLEEVTDPDTEKYLNLMMDRPRYQKSIFQTAMHLNTVSDFREFELPQKPGRDEWKPRQPTKYRNPATLAIVDEWLDTHLANKKIRESKATHPAPVTVVQRPPREPRVCLDYRLRNSRSEIPAYPMPDVQEFLEEAVGFNHYCSFDMAKMFTQFRIKNDDKHLAAFITHRGVYEPEVVMFGLAGAPQHAVREVGGEMDKDPRTNGITFTVWALEQNKAGVTPAYELCPYTKIVRGSRLRPFIDDVFIKSMHTAGIVKLVELFFEFCLDHNLILSRKKAKLMKKYLRTLGFVVSKEGKHLDPSRIIALLEAPTPKSRETLHSLLSSFTFVRMFIPNFAQIAAPLYEATKGIVWKGPQSGKSQKTNIVDPEFVWTAEMTRAFQQLQAALLEAPILVSIDWNFPLFLSVDASMRGEGWVLWQLITLSDGSKIAVAILYGSRKYSDSEKKWETTRQEANAIRSALTDVEKYVYGQHFYLFSDHLNLRFMHNSINRAVLRMKDFLAQFNMTVVHCPGVWNNADSVSRLETDALPAELASDLNSATIASLSETDLLITTGTDTSIDDAEGKEWNVHPYHEQCDKHTDTEHSTCLLCAIQSIPDWDWENFDLTHEPPRACQNIFPNDMEHVTEIYDDTDYHTVLNSIIHRLGGESDQTELNRYKNEALHWNSQPVFYQSELDNPDPIDDLDVEDLLWQITFDRNTVTAKACRALAQKRPAEGPHIDGVGKEASPITDKTTTACPHQERGTNRQVTEIADMETQTTPSDFRMASVHLPMIEDFRAIHNDTSGHHGLDFSYRKLLKRCGSKWANERGEATKIKQQLKTFLDGCPTCQKLRGLREKIKCKHSFIISRPFLEVSYDFIVFKHPDKYGNRYILAAIDNFTKLVELKAVKSREAETVAQFLLEIASRYGHCARLRSDNEASFMGQIITRLNQNRGSVTTPCVPYRPEANSVIERQNAIIMFHLTALVRGCNLGPQTKVGWSDLIPKVFSIVNNTPKNPLGISPLSMIYGVFANYDRPLLNPSANTEGNTSNAVDYVDELILWQTKLLDIAEDIQSKHFEQLNTRFNKSHEARQFHQGEFVIQRKDSTGITGKLSSRWIGPFMVTERRDNDPTHPVLDIMNLTDMTLKTAAADDCRKFNTSWFQEPTMMHDLARLAAQDLDEYVVEKILDHRPKGSKSQPLSKYLFLVKWEDFDEPTWEPYLGVKNLEPMDEYSRQHPELKIPISPS